jgi:hypothetical protein
LLRRDAKLEDALETEPSTRLQLPLWGWASNRDGNGLIAESPPVGPNVVIYWQQIGPNADRPKSVSTAIDIVANPTFTAGDFKRGVAQGVMDTVVEYALMSDGPPADNVAALFAASAARGEAWQLIEPQQRERVANLGLAADVKARIASDLDAGNIVLAPSAPVATDRGAQAGWWRIDPKTGATLGVGANGMGAALVERGSLHWWIGKGVCAFIGLGFTLAEGHAAAGTAAVTAACLVTGVHAGYAGLVRHAVIDMVLEIFLAAEYGGEPGGGGPHGGEPGGGGPNGGEPNHSGGDPNPPPVCQ